MLSKNFHAWVSLTGKTSEQIFKERKITCKSITNKTNYNSIYNNSIHFTRSPFVIKALYFIGKILALLK